MTFVICLSNFSVSETLHYGVILSPDKILLHLVAAKASFHICNQFLIACVVCLLAYVEFVPVKLFVFTVKFWNSYLLKYCNCYINKLFFIQMDL